MEKKPIVAASKEYLVKIKEALGKVAENTASINGCFFDLGEEGSLNLNLPYDVDDYFYIFFVDDYVELKVLLEQSGLPEQGHYMDGSFLLERDALEKGINLNRLFGVM